jgi:hypothetical protein
MKTLKCYIGIVRLRKWFPPGDPLAEIIARLCVLREDLALEMSGFHEDNLGELDGNSVEWRSLYFFRSFVRTMREISHALQALSRDPEFKIILADSPAKYRKEFKRVVREMNSSHGIVKQIRDSLGGHVLPRTVQSALDGMHFERFGFLEAAETGGKTHYQFAGEIVAEILMAGVPEKERLPRLQHNIEQISKLLSFHSLIDWILYTYSKARNLSFQ